jgi:hypothetical protein
VVADREYYNGEEILACEEAGITVYLPEADDLGDQRQGAFWQTGLRLCRRGVLTTLPQPSVRQPSRGTISRPKTFGVLEGIV